MALFCRPKTKHHHQFVSRVNLLKIKDWINNRKKKKQKQKTGKELKSCPDTHFQSRGDLNENQVYNLWLSLVKMIGTMPGTGIFA